MIFSGRTARLCCSVVSVVDCVYVTMGWHAPLYAAMENGSIICLK